MRDKKGTILIFTTWILLTLTILSIIVASRASSQLSLAKYEIEALQSHYLAKAALSKMIVELRTDKEDPLHVDSLKEEWNKSKALELEGKEILYSATDEDRRINLNGEIITSIFEKLIPNIDVKIANDIIRYKQDKNKKGIPGFEVLEELFLIDGMTDEIFQDIKDYVTIYRGDRGDDSKININTASEKVLKAIGIDSETILSYRRGDDGEDGTEDDNVFIDTNTLPSEIRDKLSVSSQVFRILAEVKISRNRSRHFEVILDRESGKILNWKEF